MNEIYILMKVVIATNTKGYFIYINISDLTRFFGHVRFQPDIYMLHSRIFSQWFCVASSSRPVLGIAHIHKLLAVYKAFIQTE